MMKTTQTNGHDLKRLCHLLNTMIEHLEGAEPENALGGIERDEDEAATLIESTGLADEAEIPKELCPVFKRTLLGWEEFGLEEFVGSAASHEKHPTRVSYQFTESSGTVHIRLFDYLTAIGIALGPELEPPPGRKKAIPPPGHWAEKLVSMSSGKPSLPEPDERFVRTLVVCLKGWRSRAQWRATSEVSTERDGAEIKMPVGSWKPRDEYVAAKAITANDGKLVSRQTVQGWIETDHPDVDRDPTTGAVWVDGEWLRGRLTKYHRRGT